MNLKILCFFFPTTTFFILFLEHSASVKKNTFCIDCQDDKDANARVHFLPLIVSWIGITKASKLWARLRLPFKTFGLGGLLFAVFDIC